MYVKTEMIGFGESSVAECLAECLGNAVVMAFKAQGHHWNVMGEDFTQFHDFFGDIYEDVFSSVDPMAENMRKLGALSPFKLHDFLHLSGIEERECGCDAMSMCADLLMANDVMLSSLNDCFAAAETANQQGIADFVASRIDMHQKWRWQLSAHLWRTVQACAVCAAGCGCAGANGGVCACGGGCMCKACH
jgi:starvation-inducible DNA-binding protein